MFLRHTRYAFLWAFLILVLCGIPGRDIPHFSFLEMLSFDKFVHAALFFILIVLFIRGFSQQNDSRFIKTYPRSIAFAFCIVYGGALELMQDAVFEERSADVFDFIANSFGSVTGLIFYFPVNRKFLYRLP